MILASGARSDLLARYRNRLQVEQTALKQQYADTRDVPALLLGRRHLVDTLLGDLWADLDFPASLALVAVGGYGRGELWPKSDIDLLLLLDKSADTGLKAQLEQLVGLFWDIGLEIGHSVRTVNECLEEAAADLTVQTALVEARRLAGNEALFEDFKTRFRQQLDPLAFFHSKRVEQDERYPVLKSRPTALSPTARKARADYATCRRSSGSTRRPDTATAGAISNSTVSSPSASDSASSDANCSCSACACICTCSSAGARTASCSTIKRHSPNSSVSSTRRPDAPANC